MKHSLVRKPASASNTPFFSIVTPVYRTPERYLRQCIESVRSQSFTDWEHILVDDGSGSAEVDKVLGWAARDPRVRVIVLPQNSGIVKASNTALEAARGSWVALLDHDDVLVRGALARMAKEVRAHPQTVIAYSDWSRIDGKGKVVDTFKKPDWSPERLRGNMYLIHFTVIEAGALAEVGGFREGYDGAQDHDLILRLTETGRPVRHVPEVLYKWRMIPTSTSVDPDSKPYARLAGVQAVQDHCDRIGMDAVVRESEYPGFYLLDRTPSPDAKVSVVIPTRGTQATVFGQHRTLVVDAVRTMLENTDMSFEVVVVADEPLTAPYLQQLHGMLGHRLVIEPYRKPFNFSEKVNLGALRASGDILVFANDDLEIITPRWLEQLTALAEQPDVGLAGALLLFEDGSVQHGGHVYHRGEAGHAHFGDRTKTGYFGDLVVDHEASGATAALVACRRSVWEEVGGFTMHLPGNFNDVDYCLKIRRLGYRIVVACSVRAWHFESKTRNPTVKAEEIGFLRQRWGAELAQERYARNYT